MVGHEPEGLNAIRFLKVVLERVLDLLLLFLLKLPVHLQASLLLHVALLDDMVELPALYLGDPDLVAASELVLMRLYCLHSLGPESLSLIESPHHVVEVDQDVAHKEAGEDEEERVAELLLRFGDPSRRLERVVG